MLKFSLRFLLLLSILSIVGCGGGGKNNNPITPPIDGGNNTEKQERLTVNYPPEVKSNEEITIELTANSETKNIILEQADKANIGYEPYNPPLEIKKLQNNRYWKVKFPQVNQDTIYTLYFLFVNTKEMMRFEAQINILVRKAENNNNPQPPQPNPPSIQVIYPWEDNRVNVVGDNVILTVKGYVYSRSNGYVNKVEAYIDNEKVAETIPNYDYFELDITKFGNRQGNKQLIIKATTTDNAIGEYKLNIIYDNNLLYSLAVDFLRRYSCIYHENEGKYRIVRFGNLNNGPYNKPVRVYVWQGLWPYKNYIEKACEFWTKYTGIQFQIILQNPTGEEPLPLIGIRDWFDQDQGYGAITWALTQNDPHEIIGGSIALYAGWLRGSEKYKTTTIAHELGHVLLMGVNVSIHTQDNSLMDSTAGGSEMLHTYQQLACKIMYSKNPGDSM
ncbi:MAG: hypothetical protein ACO2O4_04955 [Minisyncoccia bacterium]|jgi:hypothetical protein